jgi:UbiD family decarboxylase
MREFLKTLENDFNIITIDEQVSTKYEVSKILKEHNNEVVIFNNI